MSLAKNIAAALRRTPPGQPGRETFAYPRVVDVGGWSTAKRPLIKPTPANLRMFSKTPYVRRAINRVKNSIAALDWEIIPANGVTMNSTLAKQIEIATNCFKHPNNDDSFTSFVEALITDDLISGASCFEQQKGVDIMRPLWMYPVDALSIQIFAGWQGAPGEARYCQTLGYGNIGGIKGIELTNEELVYIKSDPTTENPFSYGAVESTFATINRWLGVTDYAGDLASNTQPSNLLILSGLGQEKLQTVRNWWRNDIEGQGQTPIMGEPEGGESKVLKLRGTDDKALFLEYQQVLLRGVAAGFDLQPLSLNITSDINRNTAEVAEDMDWNSAIKPRAKRLQLGLTHNTLHGQLGFYQLVFRFKALDRRDEKNLAEVYQLEYRNNATTPNQYRLQRGWDPLPNVWGDRTYAESEIAKEAAKSTAKADARLTSKE